MRQTTVSLHAFRWCAHITRNESDQDANMSGSVLLDSISAVIATVDGSVKVWESARKDVKFNATFEAVANRLHALRDPLQTCHDQITQTSPLPIDVADDLTKTVQECKIKAQKMRTIFEETIPGDKYYWYDRYRIVARRLGRGSRVEELMAAMTEDVQSLVSYNAVKLVSPGLSTQLERVMEEMKSLEPSLPIEDAASQMFNAYGGQQNVSTGRSSQYNSSNTGVGVTHNYGGIAGNPTFNFGKS